MSKFDFLTSGDFGDAEEFMERQKRYVDLKREDLDKISENEIVFAVTSWIESKFSEDWSDMGRVINSLPTPCINVYCADYIAKEIQNGGFGQAFFNTSRDFIGIAAQGFRALGYSKLGDVIEQALKINYDSGKKAAGRSIEDFLDFAAGEEYKTVDKDFQRIFDEKKFCRIAKDYIIKYKKYFGEGAENQT